VPEVQKPHSELHERLEICERIVREQPYRHPVSVTWYADDVRRLVEQFDSLREAAAKTLHEYDLWAEDANDGEFAIWSRDEFMASFVALRNALIWAGAASNPASTRGDLANITAKAQFPAKDYELHVRTGATPTFAADDDEYPASRTE
jgi:hypothetical protein